MTETYYFLSQNEYIVISICWFMIGAGFASIIALAIRLIDKLQRKLKQNKEDKENE